MNDTSAAIRPFQDQDETAVIGVWHRSGQAAYPFLPSWQALTLDRAGDIFRQMIRPRCNIWVGTRNEHVVAFLAMAGSYVDRMFVDPTEWRKGWGTRFVVLAKRLHPEGLELHTHQENHAARKLYEKHGFRAVKFGVSPPPESAPDVEYHWRPDDIREPREPPPERVTVQASQRSAAGGRHARPLGTARLRLIKLRKLG